MKLFIIAVVIIVSVCGMVLMNAASNVSSNRTATLNEVMKDLK